MSDDRWLQELAQVGRENEADDRSRLDERWDRLSSGQLSAEEEKELRALAETSAEARLAYEAFRPLGADFQARVVDALAGQKQAQAPVAEPRRPRSRVLPFPLSRLRRAGWLTAAAAVAASLFLLLRSPSLPPLPVYSVDELQGGVLASRSQEGPRVFPPGSALSLVVRPQHPVSGRVEVRTFLARDGDLVPWKPSLQIRDGAVRLQGEIGDEIEPGPWRLWVIVGRPGRLPDGRKLADALRTGRTRNPSWQAVYADLRVAAQPP